MIFQDDFQTFDTSKWWKSGVDWKGVSDTMAYFTGSYADTMLADDQVSVSGGMLRLGAAKRTYTMGAVTRPYGAGWVTTGAPTGQQPRAAFSPPVRIEVMAMVPKGRGMWPAICLCPGFTVWPPEIDILEVLGHRSDRAEHYFHYGTAQTPQEVGQGVDLGFDLAAGFHRYRVDWLPSSIVWYVDGVQTYQVTQNVVTTPMWLVLNNAVGSASEWPGAPDAGTVFPNEMLVDWVRVSRL